MGQGFRSTSSVTLAVTKSCAVLRLSPGLQGRAKGASWSLNCSRLCLSMTSLTLSDSRLCPKCGRAAFLAPKTLTTTRVTAAARICRQG